MVGVVAGAAQQHQPLVAKAPRVALVEVAAQVPQPPCPPVVAADNRASGIAEFQYPTAPR